MRAGSREDVAYHRLALSLMHDLEMADAFLDAYSTASPAPLSDFWFFDLLRGLSAIGALRM